MLKMNSVQKLVSFVLVGLVCLTACLSIGSSDSEKAKNEKPLVSSMTVSPEIPDEVMFCDEKIDLTRYNMHEGFDRELTSFIYFHSTTMLQFKRANRYFSIMEPILKANGIPDDLKYLAVIESNMDPRAVSYVNAVGIWQLMPATAKQYGLTVNDEIDERY
ncbi:MAG: transglycosylase SLT domain-containing protein, partial [Parabacteroides sp.]|nr:transglycosylase SLT domain-containing protein [Parabacteroides sp.]